MSIKLGGVMTIRCIIGRNGPFSVGRLETEIGEFAIKDTLLDQYDEGRYEGVFDIGRIYPTSYMAGGRMVVEIRATLLGMALAAIENLISGMAEMTEPDPIETDSRRPMAERAVPAQDEVPVGSTGADIQAAVAAGNAPDDEALFGTLWPLTAKVKLDTTVDRALFRRQKDRLKQLGYRFQPVGQTWVLEDQP